MLGVLFHQEELPKLSSAAGEVYAQVKWAQNSTLKDCSDSKVYVQDKLVGSDIFARWTKIKNVYLETMFLKKLHLFTSLFSTD